MPEFKIRTENIKPSKILDYFVETPEDREIVDRLKSDTPVILVGSRGVGKSFLLRVSESELKQEINTRRVLPVYLSFTQGAILQLEGEHQFYQWMLARLCSVVIRSLKKAGLTVPHTALSVIGSSENEQYIQKLVTEFENTWKTTNNDIDTSFLPSIDDFKDAIEDICEEAEIEAINIFFDEAAHILRPNQQRQFFGLYRDLNSPYINCNAAVYPGVTSFGNYFQPIHDSVFINLERDPLSSGYVERMRNIVAKQSDSRLQANIAKHRGNFSILAKGANGNPRFLLKTIGKAPNVSARETNDVIREFYRNEIWEEHTLLSEKYSGFKNFIDWGRNFIEEVVLPEIKNKNDSYISDGKMTSCFFWIHRDAPERVRNALTLLCYTGIVTLHSEGMKATRKEIGTRYSVNLGCLLAMENRPAATGLDVVKNISIKRMTEYGANHAAYDGLTCDLEDISDETIGIALKEQLAKSVDFLDLPKWLIDALKSLHIKTIEQVLSTPEEEIQEAYYVGKVRSRYIKNEARAAVFEYLSG